MNPNEPPEDPGHSRSRYIVSSQISLLNCMEFAR